MSRRRRRPASSPACAKASFAPERRPSWSAAARSKTKKACCSRRFATSWPIIRRPSWFSPPAIPSALRLSPISSKNSASACAAVLYGAANPSPAACFCSTPSANLPLSTRWPPRLRRRQPGSPRRTQHSRARALRRSHRHRQPLRKFPRHRQLLRQPQRRAHRRTRRTPARLHVADRKRRRARHSRPARLAASNPSGSYGENSRGRCSQLDGRLADLMNPLARPLRRRHRRAQRALRSRRAASRRLQQPVVSIGNLSVGGSGKTPFVIALGELLKARGFASMCSLAATAAKPAAPGGSRWRRRRFWRRASADRAPVGVPVIVGEDRYEAGQFAEGNFGRSCTFWTMDSSIAAGARLRHRADDAARFEDRLLPRGGCASRCRRWRAPTPSCSPQTRQPMVRRWARTDMASAARHRRARRVDHPASLRHRPPGQFFAQLRGRNRARRRNILRDHHAYD